MQFRDRVLTCWKDTTTTPSNRTFPYPKRPPTIHTGGMVQLFFECRERQRHIHRHSVGHRDCVAEWCSVGVESLPFPSDPKQTKYEGNPTILLDSMSLLPIDEATKKNNPQFQICSSSSSSSRSRTILWIVETTKGFSWSQVTSHWYSEFQTKSLFFKLYLEWVEGRTWDGEWPWFAPAVVMWVHVKHFGYIKSVLDYPWIVERRTAISCQSWWKENCQEVIKEDGTGKKWNCWLCGILPIPFILLFAIGVWLKKELTSMPIGMVEAQGNGREVELIFNEIIEINVK